MCSRACPRFPISHVIPGRRSSLESVGRTVGVRARSSVSVGARSSRRESASRNLVEQVHLALTAHSELGISIAAARYSGDGSERFRL